MKKKSYFLQLSSEKTHATACQSKINVFKELAEKLAEVWSTTGQTDKAVKANNMSRLM